MRDITDAILALAMLVVVCGVAGVWFGVGLRGQWWGFVISAAWVGSVVGLALVVWRGTK